MDRTPTYAAAAQRNVPADTPSEAPQRIHSTDLFGRTRRIEIVHQGETYHLQITRNGKLILTK